MELIERYLQAVGFWLPNRQKDDIIAELSADIHAQVEEQETTLGRKMNQAEVEALLKKRGRPVLVANRFLPQESLIGPVLFPVYCFILKVVSLCYLVPWLLITIGLMIANPALPANQASPSWLTALATVSGHLWTAAFISFGTVTLIFAIMERVQARSNFLEEWSPSKLPPARNRNLIPRFSSSIEIAVNWVFLIWWAAYAHSSEILIGSSVRVSLHPQWSWFYWGYFILALCNATLAAANLLQPYWTATRATLRLLSDAVGAGLFCWLMKANILAGISLPNVSPQRAMEVTQAINHWVAAVFPVGVIIAFVVAATDIYRIIRVKNA